MESSENPTKSEEISVSLPEDLVDRLNEMIPPRQQNQFIAEAIEEYLVFKEQSAALEETAGAWSDDNHPEMKTEADIDRWLNQLRKGWVETI